MADHNNRQVTEVAELSREEMAQVQGGSLAINFVKIEYKYTPFDDK